MPSGGYVGWLAETAGGRVIAGAGVTIFAWPGSPDDATGRRALVQNVYTEPEFRRQGLARLKSVMAVLRARPDFDSLDVPALLNALVADGATVQVVYVHGHWRSVNDLEELRHAVDFAHGQNLLGTATDEDGGSRR